MERRTPKVSVTEKLGELTTGATDRSETARLRDIFGSIEAAIAAGVSRAAIVKALNESGFRMTLKSFESALYRIRRSQRAGHAGEPARRPEGQESSDQTARARDSNNTGLSRQERREALANTFITAEAANPLLQQLNLKSKEKQ